MHALINRCRARMGIIVGRGEKGGGWKSDRESPDSRGGGRLTVGSTNSPTRSGFLNMAFTAAFAWVTTAISSSSRAFRKGVSLLCVVGEGREGRKDQGGCLGNLSFDTQQYQFPATTYRVLPGMRSVWLVGRHLLVGANARQGCDRRHTTTTRINMIDM